MNDADRTAPPPSVDIQATALPSGHAWVAAGVFFAALAAYLATLCRGVFPGVPAEALSIAAGAGSSIPSLTHPLWEGLVRAVRALAGPEWIGLLNAVHAVLGAASAAFLFHLAAVFPTGIPPQDAMWLQQYDGEWEMASGLRRPGDAALAHAPALLAALMGAASFPFWFAATRAYPAVFDMTLLLAGAAGIALYGRTGRRAAMLAAALVLGAAAADAAGVWVLMPALAIWAAALMIRRRDLILPFMSDDRHGRFAATLPAGALALWLLGTLGPWLIRAALFAREPAAKWVDATAWGSAVWETLRAQWRAMRDLVPSLGWLLPVLSVGLPAALILGAAAGERPGRRWPALASYLLASAVAVAIAWDAPFAPWPLFGTAPFYVLPYLAIALWTAASAAGVLRLWLRDLDRTDLPGPLARVELTPVIRRRLAWGFAATVVVALAAAGGLHAVQVARCDSAPFDEFAREAIAEAGDADRLIVVSDLAPLLEIQARRAGSGLQLLDFRYGRHPAYLRYVADVFADDPRARGLASAGLDAVLMDWIARDPAATQRAVVLDVPDLWRVCGYAAVPGRWLYRGATAAGDPSLDGRWTSFASWTSQYASIRARIERLPEPFQPHGAWLLRQTERLMNDVGMDLEEAGRTAEALVVYDAVATFHPAHISALHNRARLAATLGHPAAERYRAEVEEWRRRMGPATALADQARLYGRIRDPAAAMLTSLRAASAGVLDAAVAELTAAAEWSDNPSIRMALAAVLEHRGDVVQSRAMLDQLAEAEPDRPQFRLASGVAAMVAGDLGAARAAVARLRALPQPPASVAILEAMIAARAGDTERAKDMLIKHLAEYPDDRTAHVAAAWIAWLRNDWGTLRQSAEALRTRKTPVGFINVLLATAAMHEGRRREARDRLEETVALQPSYAPAWEALLSLDHMERRMDLAEEHTRRLLRLRPNHPRANHFLASFHFAAQRWEEAEAALRIAIAGTPDDPYILNDLAWTLLQQRRPRDALPLARRASELRSDDPSILDTFGLALLETGDTETARHVLRQALQLAPDNASIRAHLQRSQSADAQSSGGGAAESRPTAPGP